MEKFFNSMSIIADKTNGYTSMCSFLFFAQSMSSAFSWITVKFIVNFCVLSGGWHWMMTSEMYTYAVIQEWMNKTMLTILTILIQKGIIRKCFGFKSEYTVMNMRCPINDAS